MLRKLVAATMLALTVPAIGAVVVDDSGMGVPDDVMAMAIRGIKQDQSDPQSVQLRRLRWQRPLKVLCGEFNARGPGSGYLPFRPFMMTSGQVVAVPDPSDVRFGTYAAMVARECG